MRPGAGMVLAGLVLALGGCETSRDEPVGDRAGQFHDEVRSQPPAASPAQDAAALEAEARRLEEAVRHAKPGRDRLVAAQDAVAAWALWSEATGKALPASAKRVATIAAREEAAAARSAGRKDARQRGLAPARDCCKVCTTGCPCGDTCISCRKTCRKGPGCAC